MFTDKLEVQALNDGLALKLALANGQQITLGLSRGAAAWLADRLLEVVWALEDRAEGSERSNPFPRLRERALPATVGADDPSAFSAPEPPAEGCWVVDLDDAPLQPPVRALNIGWRLGPKDTITLCWGSGGAAVSGRPILDCNGGVIGFRADPEHQTLIDGLRRRAA